MEIVLSSIFSEISDRFLGINSSFLSQYSLLLHCVKTSISELASYASLGSGGGGGHI